MVDCDKAINLIFTAFKNGGKLFTCGNGGSASDSEHICAELAKGFLLPRPLPASLEEQISKKIPSLSGKLQQGLPTFSLTSENALITAISNDITFEAIFAQQLISKGSPGDVLVAFSTSGSSKNVISAIEVAKILGIKSILLTGSMKMLSPDTADVIVASKHSRVDKIQEDHVKYYHYICEKLEQLIYG